MGKSTEEFINEILEAELGNHSMLVDIREKNSPRKTSLIIRGTISQRAETANKK